MKSPGGRAGRPARRKPVATNAAEAATAFDGFVVGVGASAGGLEALERFFSTCPADTGAAFVVIQHLSPDHKSMMSNLLSRHTGMPVIMVEDGMAIRADSVCLIPPGAMMHVSRGRLHLTPKDRRGLTLPIDVFFASLAEVFGGQSIGVVLSGTGSDGTRGAVAINAAGGFVVAQAPASAKFDGMPRSAIATGVVDAVLEPEAMPRRVLDHMRNVPQVTPLSEAGSPVPANAPRSRAECFENILERLLAAGGIDFRDYKPATILRRIERRMQVRHAPRLEDYCDLLEQDRSEILVLRREMLIAVTSFFRDPEVFASIAESVVPSILARKGANDTIRIWSAGCSSGEEAYSLGMLFLEAFEKERRWPALKIFATDVDPHCVEVASQGQYPESAAAELTQERLERFFTRRDGRLLVKSELRQCIVFARHNLLSDPPFTRMDLVACRNTLIYFNAPAQDRALRTLGFALAPSGYLLLGTSESLGAGHEGLRPVHARHKIFEVTGSLRTLLAAPRRRVPSPVPGATAGTGFSRRPARGGASGVVEAALADLCVQYAPPAILVGPRLEAVHFFGAIQPFLRLREGNASLALSHLLPETLVPIASALVHKVTREEAGMVSDLVRLRKADSTEVLVRLAARIAAREGDERYVLLCFESRSLVDLETQPQPIDVDAETAARVEILERELGATRDSLQATIEELETSNEELQATNEELMASNEELQSSNEELQSVNEELNTVNAEYQEKMLVLNRVNADLDSMARATGVATVFVDRDLQLTRFSPDASSIFKLRDSDVGRELDDFAHTLDYPELAADMRRTLESGGARERQVTSRDGTRHYLVRILPCIVPASDARGAVATFVDVTELREAARLQAIIDALPEHVAVLDRTGRIKLVNEAWRRFARLNGDPGLAFTGVGANYLDACRPAGAEDPAAAAAKGLRAVLDGDLPGFCLEYPCHSAGERRWFLMHVSPVQGVADLRAVVSHVNITPWREGR